MSVVGKPVYQYDILYIFFTNTDANRHADRASLGRRNYTGQVEYSVKSSVTITQAQIPAIGCYWLILEIGFSKTLAIADFQRHSRMATLEEAFGQVG